MSDADEFNRITGEDGRHCYTIFIENDRVQDELENFNTGSREIAEVHRDDFKCIADQRTIISNVTSEEPPEIKRLLAEYKLDNLNHSGLRLSACVAFPTCGMFCVSPGSYKNNVDWGRFVSSRVRRG